MESSREILDNPPLKRLRTDAYISWHTESQTIPESQRKVLNSLTETRTILENESKALNRHTTDYFKKTARNSILSTLEDFKKADFECFQGHLSRNVMLEFEAIPKRYLENTSRHETVDEMVAFHTEDTAVKVAVETLKTLSLHDAEKTLMEKYKAVKIGDVFMSTTDLLLRTLEELGDEDFKRFQQQLSHKLVIVFEAIPRSRLENKTREQTVDLMVGAYTEQGAMAVAVEILKLMRQNNAAKKLMEPNIYSLLSLLGFSLDCLNELSNVQFKSFQHQLSQPTHMIGFKGIPRGLLENKSRQETVDLMVAYYTEDGAVTVMVEILKRIGQRNAAKKLQKEYRDFCQKDGTVSLTFIPTTW